MSKFEVVEKIDEIRSAKYIKASLLGKDCYGEWYKIKTKFGLSGYIFSGAVKAYYIFDKYYLYYNNGINIIDKTNDKIIKTIKTDGSIIDFYCYIINDVLVIQPFKQYFYDNNFEGYESTDFYIFDLKSMSITNSFKGHYVYFSLSPSKKYLCVSKTLPGYNGPSLTYDTIFYSILNNKIIYRGDLTIDGKWLNNDDYEVYNLIGKNVKGYKKKNEGNVILEKLIFRDGVLSRTKEYMEAFD